MNLRRLVPRRRPPPPRNVEQLPTTETIVAVLRGPDGELRRRIHQEQGGLPPSVR